MVIELATVGAGECIDSFPIIKESCKKISVRIQWEEVRQDLHRVNHNSKEAL